MTAENPADTVIKQTARAITAALADAGLLADPADRDELRSQLRRARQQRDDERAAKEAALAEVAKLRRWKAEASPVMIGLQELGRALGIPLGTRITGEAAAEQAAALVAEEDK